MIAIGNIIEGLRAKQPGIAQALTSIQNAVNATERSLRSDITLVSDQVTGSTGKIPASRLYLGNGVKASGNYLIAGLGAGLMDDGSGFTTIQVGSSSPLYTDIVTKDLKLRLSSELSLDGSKAVQIDNLVVSKLRAGTALFTGDAIFAKLTGGAVTINNTGIAICDSYTTPHYTATIAANGLTLTDGTRSIRMAVDGSATGIAIYGASGTLALTSAGVVITNGSSSVTVSAGSVAIANGTFTSVSTAGTGGVVSINSSNAGVYCSYGSGNAFANYGATGLNFFSHSTETGFVLGYGYWGRTTYSGGGYGTQVFLDSDLNVWFSIISGGSYKIGSTTIIDASRNADFVSLKIGGSTVIDSSRNADVVSLKIGGTTRIDSSGNADVATLKVGGTEVIDSARKVKGASFSFAGTDGVDSGVTFGIVRSVNVATGQVQKTWMTITKGGVTYFNEDSTWY